MNEENKGEIAVVDTTAPSLTNQFDIVDVKAAEGFMQNYQDLVEALLENEDYQEIGGKRHKKKSAWRKLATAFNITDEVVNEEIVVDETNQIVSAKFYVKATLPNGRSSVGVGACSIYDKIRYKGTPNNPADDDTPSNFVLRGRFSNAEHDVPSTAHTRAKSRAISDLIGAGETSAEELSSIGGGKKNGKKRRKTAASKKESNVVETKAEVVEAEVVTEPEIVKDEKPADETQKEKKAKKKTIKTLKEEYSEINNVIEKLQADKKKVTRENILEALMDAYESDEITLSDYQILKKELTQ